MLISILACCRHNFSMQYFYENGHFKNEASVALNPLVSLFGRFVARGGRKRGNRHTHTDKVRNPRCACAPRVNSFVHVIVLTVSQVKVPFISPIIIEKSALFL